MRKHLLPLLAAYLLSAPALAGMDGIWSCASPAASNPYSTDVTAYFSFTSNGNTSLMAPINWNDPYNLGSLVGVSVLTQESPTHYSGFGTQGSLATGDISALNVLAINHFFPGSTSSVVLNCSKIW